MRRHLQQTFDSSSYDVKSSANFDAFFPPSLAYLVCFFKFLQLGNVLEANPWRDPSKPVYVLTHKENQLCTMKTRRNRSEVETKLGLLFSKGAKRSSRRGSKTEQPRSGTKFDMLVEDVREGVLVFEDENEAAKYCDLMHGGGKGCEGVAEIEASSVLNTEMMKRAENTDWKKIYKEFGVLKHKIVHGAVA